MDEEVPVPPQLKLPALHDFRGAPTNQRGFLLKNKRKLDDYAEQVRTHTTHMKPGVVRRRRVNSVLLCCELLLGLPICDPKGEVEQLWQATPRRSRYRRYLDE